MPLQRQTVVASKAPKSAPACNAHNEEIISDLEAAAFRSHRAGLEYNPSTVHPKYDSHGADENREREDSFESLSSSESASSHYSLFSDPESEMSEISLQEAIQPKRSSELLDSNRVGHERLPSGSSSESFFSPSAKSKLRHRSGSPSSEEDTGPTKDPLCVKSFPDWSRCSRRPPSASILEHSVHVPAHSGHVAVAGSSVVVASGHHIKYYNVASSDVPSWIVETRDYMGGSMVSCLEFKHAHDETDRGKYLWVGTKDGLVVEVDVRTGACTSFKGMHAARVTDIFRHGSRMVTVDEAGKTLVFDCAMDSSDVDEDALGCAVPRVFRFEEKPEFVKLLGGFLWTASYDVGTTPVVVIRIYDVHTRTCIGRAVVANQHAGTVTSGTILPSQPDYVYLGHKGGYISAWCNLTGGSTPVCVDMIKVGMYDVLSLEGVNDRLWAGARKGTITIYDVTTKPWIITNCWDAHGGLPVERIFVDPHAIIEMGKLTVVSVGQDEQIKFWDGLLGADRIEGEMLKRENTYCTPRDLKVLIVSWNVDAAKPEFLTGTGGPENACFLQDVLASADSPDIISFGFQEVIDLESRTMAAKTILLGSKHKAHEGKIDEKLASNYKRWHDQLIHSVKLAMPPDSPYTVAHTETLVGLFTCMFIKDTVKASVKEAAIATIKRGMGGHYGNKGAIVARFSIDNSSMCFVNCHLAAGQHHVQQRNADVTAVLEEIDAFPVASNPEVGYAGGGDGSMVLDHEIVFLNGDMNYRVDQPRCNAIAAVQASDLTSLLVHDQLYKEIENNPAFPLRAFNEGPLTFPPTYKYDRYSNTYDSSEKQRVPAWCDRVLWRSRVEDKVKLLEYRRWEATVSDHRPVSATFRVTAKKVEEEQREREKKAVVQWWSEIEDTLLADAHAFYAAQAVVSEL